MALELIISGEIHFYFTFLNDHFVHFVNLSANPTGTSMMSQNFL